MPESFITDLLHALRHLSIDDEHTWDLGEHLQLSWSRTGGWTFIQAHESKKLEIEDAKTFIAALSQHGLNFRTCVNKIEQTLLHQGAFAKMISNRIGELLGHDLVERAFHANQDFLNEIERLVTATGTVNNQVQLADLGDMGRHHLQLVPDEKNEGTKK